MLDLLIRNATPFIKRGQAQIKGRGCFVAGTLVHTREGLRPIEQIQVGDYVLSKPESGDGETSYQPVTKTLSYEDRELYLVNMTELDPSTGRVVNGKSEYVAVTGAHPIWVQSYKQLNWVEDVQVIAPVNGWVSVEDIYLKNCHAYWAGPEEQLTGPDALVLLANGAPAIMHSPEPILKAHLSNEGVLFADNDTWIEDGCMGRKLLFSANGVEFVQGSVALGDAKAAGYDYTDYDIDSARSVVKRSGGHLPIRRRVYNLEVAHNHSYFVGKLGLWVHNTSGLELRTLPLSPTQNLGIFVGDEAEVRLVAELAKRADGKGIAIIKMDWAGKYVDYGLVNWV
jgi:hypothetical protein